MECSIAGTPGAEGSAHGGTASPLPKNEPHGSAHPGKFGGGCRRGMQGPGRGWRAQGRGGGQGGDARIREEVGAEDGTHRGQGRSPAPGRFPRREREPREPAGLGAGCPLLLSSLSLLLPVQGVQLAGQAGCPLPRRRREEGAQQMAAHKGTSGRRRRRRKEAGLALDCATPELADPP